MQEVVCLTSSGNARSRLPRFSEDPPVQFVDRELTRRFEASEAIPQVHFAAVLQRLKPELNVAHEEIAGSQCVFIHPGCVVGRCVSLGLTGAVTASDLDRIEDFYRSRGEAAQIDVCPTSDQSLFELMKQRPYRLEELNDVLVRRLHADDNFDDGQVNAEIRRLSRDKVDEVCEVVARGFFEGKAPEPSFVDIFRPLYLTASSIAFAAFVDGQMVGGGAVMGIPEAGIATMFGSSPVPEYRGRGIQSSFLRERLKV